VEAQADEAAAFIRALGLTHVDVLGFSIGGYVAQGLTLPHRGLVRRLVLAGTKPRAGNDTDRHPVPSCSPTAGTRSRWRRNSASTATRQTAPGAGGPSAATLPTCASASTKALPGCRPTSLTCTTCTGVT